MSQALHGVAREEPGSVVMGRFRLVRVLGVGGMGAIYLARVEGAEGFTKPVVLKRLLPKLSADPGQVRSFIREARISSFLSHPNIVPVHDFREEEHTYWLILDYVAGYDLQQWMRYRRAIQAPIAVEHALAIARAVLSALSYAHELCDAQGEPLHIVHRDISTSNVLLGVDGRVYLTDFGIARMREDVSGFQTEEASIKGKFPCLAPEILEGAAPSPQSDLYSAALLLHQMLAGDNEFKAKTMAKTVAQVLTHVPTRATKLRPEAPPGLDLILARALAKRPEDRPKSAGELLLELEALGTFETNPPPPALAAQLAQDFADPRFRAVNRVESLAERQVAWQSTDAGLPAPVEITVDVSDLDQAIASNSALPPSSSVAGSEQSMGPLGQELVAALNTRQRTQSEERPSGLLRALLFARKRFVLVGSLAVMVAAGVGALAVEHLLAPVPLELEAPSAPAVEVTKAPLPEPPVEAPVAPAAKEAPVSAAEAPRRSEETSTRRKEQALVRRLTQRFAARSDDIEGCFRGSAVSADDGPEALIQFDVDRTGRVRSADIEPKSVAGSPLGACLLRIALSTTFGPQVDQLVFQIPVRARGLPRKKP